MYPYLFGVKFLPMYGILMALGAIVAVVVAVFRKRCDNLKRIDIFLCALFAIIFGLIFAKLFAIFGNLKYVISGQLSFVSLLRSGFVFYGGLIGGIFGGVLYVKLFDINFLKMFDALAVCIPLGHAIGRLGCFCTGCCYGKPTNSAIGIVFTNPLDAATPVGVKLVPTQLIEAAALIFIFAVLMLAATKITGAGVLAYIYCFMYASARFIIEFFRGDIWRVFNNSLTGSQLISIAIIIILIGIGAAHFNKKRKNPILYSVLTSQIYSIDKNI